MALLDIGWEQVHGTLGFKNEKLEESGTRF